MVEPHGTFLDYNANVIFVIETTAPKHIRRANLAQEQEENSISSTTKKCDDSSTLEL